MKTIKVKVSQAVSLIHIGETLKNVEKYLPKSNVIIITDQNVKKLYSQDFPTCPIITIETGENIKTLDTLNMIFKELIKLGADRKTFILGIGGGIVCDITGFAACIYMRGLKFGFVSTTLLSQVDASVGGKNGVNFDSYKNMIGVFCQPEFVICDTSLLKTLSSQEISNGFAEIVKHALIFDEKMLNYIESNIDKALNLDHEVITKLVIDSVELKAGVVQRDEKESGERKKLNFGHTIGHALEKITGISHGMAISIGMVKAAYFSYKKDLITNQDCQRISDILQKLNLPVKINADIETIIDAMKKDKKKENNNISFVFLDKIGNSIVEKISLKNLRTYFD